MKERERQNWTPLTVIGASLAVIDAALAVAASIASGALQWFLAAFAAAFASAVLTLFFLTLWKRPMSLHPPEAFDSVEKLQEYARLLKVPRAVPVPEELENAIMESVEEASHRKMRLGPPCSDGAAVVENLARRQFLFVRFDGQAEEVPPLVLFYSPDLQLHSVMVSVFEHVRAARISRGASTGLDDTLKAFMAFFAGRTLIHDQSNRTLSIQDGIEAMFVDGFRHDTLAELGVRSGHTLVLRQDGIDAG